MICKLIFSVEFKSVYVRNVPPTASAFEIEEEFKRFGKIKPDGVAIRTRKVSPLFFPLVGPPTFLSQVNEINFNHVYVLMMQDLDVCYAFVEFEDITGVQNAIKVGISFK